MSLLVACMFRLCVNNLCRPTGVLPAVPPIPKAPGTLMPSPALHRDVADKTSSNQHKDAAPARLESLFFLEFLHALVHLLLAHCTAAFVLSYLYAVESSCFLKNNSKSCSFLSSVNHSVTQINMHCK